MASQASQGPTAHLNAASQPYPGHPRVVLNGSLSSAMPKVSTAGGVAAVQTRVAPLLDAYCTTLLRDDFASRSSRLPLFLHCLQFLHPTQKPHGTGDFDPRNPRHAQAVDDWGLPYLHALFAKSPFFFVKAQSGQGRYGGDAWAFVPLTASSAYSDRPVIFITTRLSDLLDSATHLLQNAQNEEEVRKWEGELDVLEYFVYTILIHELAHALPRFAGLLSPQQSTPLTFNPPSGSEGGEQVWEVLFGGVVLLGHWGNAAEAGRERYRLVTCLADGAWREILPVILSGLSSTLVEHRFYITNPFLPPFTASVAASGDYATAKTLTTYFGASHVALPDIPAPLPFTPVPQPLHSAPAASPAHTPPPSTPRRPGSTPLPMSLPEIVAPSLHDSQRVPQLRSDVVPVPEELFRSLGDNRHSLSEWAVLAAPDLSY
ncbi:hypothetical protein JCM10207_006746 [Rhodosporidiobolus poonsookiae]